MGGFQAFLSIIVAIILASVYHKFVNVTYFGSSGFIKEVLIFIALGGIITTFLGSFLIGILKISWIPIVIFIGYSIYKESKKGASNKTVETSKSEEN